MAAVCSSAYGCGRLLSWMWLLWFVVLLVWFVDIILFVLEFVWVVVTVAIAVLAVVVRCGCYCRVCTGSCGSYFTSGILRSRPVATHRRFLLALIRARIRASIRVRFDITNYHCSKRWLSVAAPSWFCTVTAVVANCRISISVEVTLVRARIRVRFGIKNQGS